MAHTDVAVYSGYCCEPCHPSHYLFSYYYLFPIQTVTGCFPKFMKLIDDNSTVIVGVALGIAALEVCLILRSLSCCLLPLSISIVLFVEYIWILLYVQYRPVGHPLDYC